MQANATIVIADKTDYNTNEYIESKILRLEPIRLCNDILTFNAAPDFINAFSDMYLVPGSNIIGGAQIPPDPAPHRDLEGLSKPNEGYPIVVDEFDPDTPEIIAFPNNVKGGSLYHYIVFDHCQDGKFTDREDEVISFPLFKVKGATEDLPNLDKIRLKTSASIKLFEYERNLGIAKIAISTILSAIVAYGVYRLASNPTAAIASFIVSELSVGGFLGGFIVNIFAGWVSGATNLIEKEKRIAKDPPDFNYETSTSISQPVKPDFNPPNPFQVKSIPSIIQYAYDLNNEAALTEGLLHSIERYDGSILNGDPAWSVIHAKEIKKYSTLLKNQIINSSQTVDNLVESIKKDTIFPNDSEKSDIEILRNDVRQNGWNSSNIQQMKNLGLDDDQIKNITSQFLTGEIFTKNQFAGLLENTTSTDNSMMAALDDLIEQADKNINAIITKTSNIFIYDYLPVADAGGPYSGFVNKIISFNGSGSHSSSLSNITKYEWDLDSDGGFDDSTEQNPQIQYDYPFKGFAGLKVTNQDNWSDISYSYVNITDTNNAPVINEFSPVNLNQTVILNNNILFNVTATDIDIDDNISIDWLVDNTTSAINSQTFEYSPTLNDIGIHLVQAKVSDSNTSNSTTVKTWIVEVLDVDSDVDGWNANVDCNDNNSSINPGVQEIRYNGIDDDCNSQTLDINTPPVAKNRAIGFFQNSVRTISFSGDVAATDVDHDLLTFEIVKGPENGTLGPIKINPFNPGIITADYTPNPNFHGKDSFTFIAKDQFSQSNIAKTDISVGILQLPSAVDRTITVTEDTPTQIELRGISPDGHPLTFILEGTRSEGTKGQPVMGTIKNITQTSPTTANVTYIPPTDFNNDISTLVDSITFAVKDGEPVPGFEGRENRQR